MALKSKGIFIVGAKRTPFCKVGGPLSELPASHAFAAAAKDAIRSANLDPNTIDHTVIGNVHFLSQCDGGKTPRYCGIYSGVPIDRPALGLNKACASGIQAIITSSMDILTGVAKITLTGGTEIMSSLPHLVRNIRFGTALGGKYLFEDHITTTKLIDSYCGKSVQTLSENLGKKYGIKRDEADEMALQSNLKLKSAQENENFKDEITSVTVTRRNKEVLVHKDSTPINSTPEDLSKFPLSLENGSLLTSGNSCFPADGASAILLADEESIKLHQLTPLARISGWACAGVDPQEFGLGSLAAVRKLLDDQKTTVQDVDLFEINETFASEVIITIRELSLDPSRVNINGGALSMGHPVAATGARMVTHLVHQLRSIHEPYSHIHHAWQLCNNKKLKRAVATSSAGGGQGVALMIEATSM